MSATKFQGVMIMTLSPQNSYFVLRTPQRSRQVIKSRIVAFLRCHGCLASPLSCASTLARLV